MCTMKPTANAITEHFGRITCVTTTGTVTPVVKGDTPEESLAIYYPTNEFKVNHSGTRIIGRNPLLPIPCSESGDQLDIIADMGLGLSKSAEILWVKLRKNFTSGTAKGDAALKEVDGEVFAEMRRNKSWSMTKMAGVEIALPNDKPEKAATHWLVRQPLTDDMEEQLNWPAIQGDALGIWKTPENLYFVVPAGYRDVLLDELADEENACSLEEFFAESAKSFRERSQKIFDDWSTEEQTRSNNLPNLLFEASNIVTQYRQTMQSIPVEYFGDSQPLDLEFDDDGEQFVYNGTAVRLTNKTLEEFKQILQDLQDRVTKLYEASRRIDSFRGVLDGLTESVTIKDLGDVRVTGGTKHKGSEVTIELDLMQATLTVVDKNGAAEEKQFSYTDPGSASAFYAELKSLKLIKEEKDEKGNDGDGNKKRGFVSGLMHALRLNKPSDADGAMEVE